MDDQEDADQEQRLINEGMIPFTFTVLITETFANVP